MKLPAADVLGARIQALPHDPLPPEEAAPVSPPSSPPIEQPVAPLSSMPTPAPRQTYRPVRYRERDGVGYLYFDFYNGAMGSRHCRQLLAAYRDACARDTRVLVLMGGDDFFSNGIHLNLIEAAASPADESWANINAMDDLVAQILQTTDKLTVAALRGNAGAGGVFLALAADRVLAHDGVILNPHYKNMGNLYGSEYWTYVLPRRVGADAAATVMQHRLPLGAAEAAAMGLLDRVLDRRGAALEQQIADYAGSLASDPELARLLAEKQQRRRRDEAAKPLAQYRAEELERMQLNFYGFDPSYHVARYNFVYRRPHSWTPLHLARHRRKQPA